MRKIFEYAKALPCVLFLDEFDANGKCGRAMMRLKRGLER
ncbi:hypothetical protein [Paenibacillus sp. FSL L8-0709]